jgi:hypothetical protein
MHLDIYTMKTQLYCDAVRVICHTEYLRLKLSMLLGRSSQVAREVLLARGSVISATAL